MIGRLPYALVPLTLVAALTGCTTFPYTTIPATPPPAPTTQPIASPSNSPVAGEPTVWPTATTPSTKSPAASASSADPFALISTDSLLSSLEDLTAIQPYSGWRNSASEGEAEALDYVAGRLEGFSHLRTLGLALERQSFNVFLGTELWDTRLHLTIDGREVEVPADGLRGDRDDVELALRFDSDGSINDSARDPVVVEGPVLIVSSAAELAGLSKRDVKGRVVLLDFAVIDRTLHGPEPAGRMAAGLLGEEPLALVLVTRFSNDPDESHGTFVADASVLQRVDNAPMPPTLYVRLEDLAPAGIEGWDALSSIETARLTWDADVFSPATSGNLIARIPGADPTRAVVLGAHIDSPNGPGAMDDGSGSAVLLEVARVLDAAVIQPPTDLYLAWFGSEELGLYGAAHFAATHQELLDRTLAMLEVDCLTRPLDGVRPSLSLVTWSYGRLGDDQLTWPDYLARTAAQHGSDTSTLNVYHAFADNSVFGGFDVPNADLIYMDARRLDKPGGVHASGHIHDPYDTVELAQDVVDVLEHMARVALTAVLDVGQYAPGASGRALRVTPLSDRRALFIASHTEPVHMSPTSFTELGMALAMAGFDVDVIPYGRPLTATELETADMVVALPVMDYPSLAGEPDTYDEAWREEEVAALEQYVSRGGLLVLTNSGHRLKYGLREFNEDWSDANNLAEPFGVSFNGTLPDTSARPLDDHPLMHEVPTVDLAAENALGFTMAGGTVLARAESGPVVGLIDHGEAGGQVLVLADASLLAPGWSHALTFWQNLAVFARSR